MTHDQDVIERDVYYIFRAMHDATCPSCGHSAETFEDERFGNLTCPECKFTLTHGLQHSIQALAPKVLKRRLASLTVFQAQLDKPKRVFGATNVHTMQQLSPKALALVKRAEALGYNVERNTAPHGWEMFSNEKEPGVVREFMSLNHLERDIEDLERNEV
jgi:hypothetical protein